jgi:GT2 family glycosyltransferase
VTIWNGFARLRAAHARHGALNLVRLLLGAAGELGLLGTLKVARGDQPFLSIELPARPASQQRTVWPAALGTNRLVPTAAWSRWLRKRLARSRSGKQNGAAVILHAGPDGWDHADLPLGGADAFCVFLGAGDDPRPELLPALRSVPAEAQIVTFDLYRRTAGGIEPLLLPGADPVLLAERDYLFSRAAFRGRLLAGEGLRGPGGVREAILRWCAGRPLSEVRAGWKHIGLPLVESAIPHELHPAPALARRQWDYGDPTPIEPVSVVLCTRDKGHLTRQLSRRLLADPLVGELVIVSNGTRNPYALKALDDLAREEKVTILERDEPFNFSRLCNTGAGHTRLHGPLLFINDDVAPVTEDWLALMCDHLRAADTGAVGPLLLYPDERVQHAGMYMRHQGGAGHLLRFARLPEDDYLGLAASTREVSAVTGAVLLTRRTDFEAVGGLDERLAIGLQDVDYCLKLRRLGRRNLFEPRAVLLHMESTTLQSMLENPAVAKQRHQDLQRFRARWGDDTADPFFPAGFDPTDEGLHRLSRP